MLFVVAVRAKAKPGGTSERLARSSRKRKPLHAWPLHYLVTPRGDFCSLLVTRLKLENRKLVSPIPIMAHNRIGTKLQTLSFGISAAATIASLVMLKAFYPSQFGGKDSEGSRKAYSWNVKRDNNLGPAPLPQEPRTEPPARHHVRIFPTYLTFTICHDCHLARGAQQHLPQRRSTPIKQSEP